VTLWSHSEDEAGALTQTRHSPRLPGFELPDGVRVTSRLADAVEGASLVVSAVPVQHMRSVWEKLGREAAGGGTGTSGTGTSGAGGGKGGGAAGASGAKGSRKGESAGARSMRVPSLPSDAGVVSVAKGIENGTLLRPTQVIAGCLADDPDARPRRIGVLSGPTIASELARCLPATMIAGSDSPSFAQHLQQLFSSSWLRIYTSEDVLGVELAGASKNVIAIAAGILDGLQAGYNAKSALLARGLAEITRLGAAMGASQDTFFGLAGVGDLATTCFSPEGRNRSCGEALGRGEKLADYLSRTTSVVEGVATTRSLVDLAKKYRVDMPITQAVYAVLFAGMDPIDGIGRLMSRELKAERIG